MRRVADQYTRDTEERGSTVYAHQVTVVDQDAVGLFDDEPLGLGHEPGLLRIASHDLHVDAQGRAVVDD